LAGGVNDGQEAIAFGLTLRKRGPAPFGPFAVCALLVGKFVPRVYLPALRFGDLEKGGS